MPLRRQSHPTSCMEKYCQNMVITLHHCTHRRAGDIGEFPVFLNFPARHNLHNPSPCTTLYFPFTHAIQPYSPCGVPVYPLLQVQSLASLLPSNEFELEAQAIQTSDVAPVCVENLPPVHCVHGDEPVELLNVPGTHALHAPSGPVEPAGHG